MTSSVSKRKTCKKNCKKNSKSKFCKECKKRSSRKVKVVRKSPKSKRRTPKSQKRRISSSHHHYYYKHPIHKIFHQMDKERERKEKEKRNFGLKYLGNSKQQHKDRLTLNHVEGPVNKDGFFGGVKH